MTTTTPEQETNANHQDSPVKQISTMSHPPTTFHKFPILPTEIQLKIWKYAVESEAPRIIPIIEKKTTYKNPLSTLFARLTRSSPTRLGTPISPSALASACAQSRLVFFETYTRIPLKGEPNKTEDDGIILVDLSKDLLLFSWNWDRNILYHPAFFAASLGDAAKQVTHLAMELAPAVLGDLLHHRGEGTVLCLYEMTGHFPAIERIMLTAKGTSAKAVEAAKTIRESTEPMAVHMVGVEAGMAVTLWQAHWSRMKREDKKCPALSIGRLMILEERVLRLVSQMRGEGA